MQKKLYEMDYSLVVLGCGNDCHTVDFYKNAQGYSEPQKILFVTDIIDSESLPLLIDSNQVIKLHIIDRFLLSVRSSFSNKWRNLVKIFMLPFQVVRLRKMLRNADNPVLHAFGTYYALISRLSGFPYVVTPIGSEVLLRPYRSSCYRFFAKAAYLKAITLSVDSLSMQKCLKELYGKESILIQNGIKLREISHIQSKYNAQRKHLVSIRGISSLYQIKEIVKARNIMVEEVPIKFCYPCVSSEYKAELDVLLSPKDEDMGVLNRQELYKTLLSAKLVVSIPASDSSPRSVYEAIFCGAYVVVSPLPWVKALPKCMQERIIQADLKDEHWLSKAWETLSKPYVPYVPSDEAVKCFDQEETVKVFFERVYPAA